MDDYYRFCKKCGWNMCMGCACPIYEEIYQCPMYRFYHPEEVEEFNKAMEEWSKNHV